MPEMSALEGASAVECALLVTVPYAGAILGHMGADMVKVVPPEGDPFFRVDSDLAPGRSAYFFGPNRINRPLALNYDA